MCSQGGGGVRAKPTHDTVLAKRLKAGAERSDRENNSRAKLPRTEHIRPREASRKRDATEPVLLLRLLGCRARCGERCGNRRRFTDGERQASAAAAASRIRPKSRFGCAITTFPLATRSAHHTSSRTQCGKERRTRNNAPAYRGTDRTQAPGIGHFFRTAVSPLPNKRKVGCSTRAHERFGGCDRACVNCLNEKVSQKFSLCVSGDASRG